MRMTRELAGVGLLCALLLPLGFGCRSGVTEAIDGTASGAPVDGRDGADGLSCWDVNGDGQADPVEDINGDGLFNASDCQGLDGSIGRPGADGFDGIGAGTGADGLNCWDLNGNGQPDPDEDANGDGAYDALDCQGADGSDGLAGEPGEPGLPGASGSSGPMGPQGPAGPEYFDIYVDTFFTTGGTAGDTSPGILVPASQPVLGAPPNSSLTTTEPTIFSVPIPEIYNEGNDVTMRAYFMRSGGFDQGCFVFTVDAERAHVGGVSRAYGERRFVRVDAVDGGEAGAMPELGQLVLVDVPVNSASGLGLPSDLTGGDFLGFNLTTFQADGRAYYLLGVEFFESAAGDSRPVGGGVFASADDVVCGFADCNRNFIPDSLDIDAGTSLDCNRNGVPDRCELDEATSEDCNGNGVPDECDLCGGPGAVAGGMQQPFAFLHAGFTQQLYATGDGLVGGIAFAPDGDLLVDRCLLEGSGLQRFDAQTTELLHGTPVHPLFEVLTSNAGCGLANHPDGSLYSNTVSGVSNLDTETASELRDAYGHGGNALGIATDPQTGDLIYVGSDGTLYFVDAAFTARGVFSDALRGDLIQGVIFDLGGEHLLCANRTRKALSVLLRDGSLVQTVPLLHNDRVREPMAVAIHLDAPWFAATVNADGSMTRLDFPADDLAATPSQSLLAGGGFRADMCQVGSDGCLYVTQTGTRFLDGTISLNGRSVVRVCGGFLPQPGAIGSLRLSPDAKTVVLGATHTVTAEVLASGEPAVGVEVVFEVVSGPHNGLTAAVVTDAAGTASFRYTGIRGTGTDHVQAFATLGDGGLLSNVVGATWVFPDCSLDCNENGVPDECELLGNDCNDNGVPDECDGGCE